MRRLRPPSLARRCAALAFLLAGCAKPLVDECTTQFEARQYEVAVETCMNLYEQTRNAHYGLMAAQACRRYGSMAAEAGERLKLRRQALRLARDLQKSEYKADAAMLAGRIHVDLAHAAGGPESQAEYEQALASFRRAAALFRESGDLDGESGAVYAQYYVFHRNAEYPDALKASARALDLAQSKVSRFKALEGFSGALIDIGDLDRAQAVLESALKEMSEPETHADPAARARLLNSQAGLHLLRNRPESAALAASGALRAYEPILKGREIGGQDYIFMRSTLLNLAQADLDHSKQKLTAARAHIDEAWEYKQGEATPALILVRARIQHEKHEHRQAMETLSQALELELDAESAWQIHYLMGQAAEASQDPHAAEKSYRAAIENLEGLRGKFEINEFKSWLLEGRRQPYESLFNLLATTGRAREALETADRIQARTFLDAFIKSTSSSVPFTPSDPANGPAVDVARAAAERLESLNSLLPAMSRAAAIQPLPPDETLETVRRRSILAYFDAGDRIWLIQLRDGRPVEHELGSADEINLLADEFLADRDDDSRHRLEKLGEILLPDGSLPPVGETIYIVADRELRKLPFAALRRSGRYLVEDHPIVYPPSLSALARTTELPAPSGAAAVIGDPLGDLEGARSEAQQAARLLLTEAALGEEASKTRFWQAKGARILHLSTHTGLNESGPWLQLADGRVTAEEVIYRKMAPGLAVLATCASATRRGTQFWGSLGAAFLAAGTRSVLATLWSVEDRNAREFIVRFHEAGGASPAAALAEAQRELIADEAKVSVWAPYVLFGSDPHWEGADEGAERQ